MDVKGDEKEESLKTKEDRGGEGSRALSMSDAAAEVADDDDDDDEVYCVMRPQTICIVERVWGAAANAEAAGTWQSVNAATQSMAAAAWRSFELIQAVKRQCTTVLLVDMLTAVLEDTPLMLLMMLLQLKGGLLVTTSDVCVAKSDEQNSSSLQHRCCKTISNANDASATSTSIPTSTRASAPAISAECCEIPVDARWSVPSLWSTHNSGGSSSAALSNAQPKSGRPPVDGAMGAGLKSRYLKWYGFRVQEFSNADASNAGM
jgi:hypothetical protein